MSKAHIPPAVAISGCNAFGENERVLNIWLQNEYCIDALILDEKFPYSLHGRGKEKCASNWTDKHAYLVLQYIVQIVISDSCLKFQNSMSSSYWEFFDENFHNRYIGERWKRGRIEKEGKTNSHHLDFVYRNTFDCPQHIYKI